MKKNFYKEFHKKQKVAQTYNETDKVIVERPNILLKILSYSIYIISNIFRLILFIAFIILISIGATFIFNNVLHINLVNMIGGN